MAVSVPVKFNGMYCGDMDETRISLILAAREIECIPNLKGRIYEFPTELISESLADGVSIREMLLDSGRNIEDYRGELRDYQTVGTAFMYLSPRSILGDGVGLGKTAETGALINYLKDRGELTRFLMAVENSAVFQTVAELTKFTGLRILNLNSHADKMKRQIKKIDWNKVDGIVISHSTLRSDVLSRWLALNLDKNGMSTLYNTFILDESSVIKNTNTKLYQYTKNLANIAVRTHFLNATTFETNIMDIYNQADMMMINLLPKKHRIEKEYCKFKMKSYWRTENGKPVMKFARDLSGYKNQSQFKEALKLVYFGRCKADIGMEIPHQYKVYEVEPSLDQLVAIEQGHRYMEILNCPSMVEELSIPMDRKHVPKLDRLITMIENEFSDSNIMIYCFHTAAQKAIADALTEIGRKPAILNGSVTGDKRWEIQNKFNEGEYDTIITNIKKSLNLYGGDVCIFYSMETVPASVQQISGRIDRNVDDRTKTFVLLVYKHTDEYKMLLNTVRQRAKDARDLTIDSKGTIDFFIESMGVEE